jgi:NADH:ubiquinone oxidoreductase subunit 6 (subunit J)
MTYQPNAYETAKRSLRRKMLPGIVILIILALCILLLIQRKNAPVRPPGTPLPAQQK